MTYIENVLVCMVAPLLVALLLLRRKQRPLLLFCLAGMGMCLLAAYLNTFFAQLYAADALNAATQIAPVVEEIMKLLPLLFYLAVFEPDAERFRLAAIVVAASFATFENVCYLTQNGAGQFVYLLIRGFGTGAMHIVCGSVYGRVLRPAWGSRPLRAACLFGLLCVAIIYHAIYNLLVSVGGTAQLLAYATPPAHGAVLPPARAADRSAKAIRSSDRPRAVRNFFRFFHFGCVVFPFFVPIRV